MVGGDPGDLVGDSTVEDSNEAHRNWASGKERVPMTTGLGNGGLWVNAVWLMRSG